MRFTRDYFSNITPPPYILTKANGERIKTINCSSKRISFNFNAPDTISFSTYRYIDGEINPVYDLIVNGQYIEVHGFGRFIISSVSIASEDTDFESKQCECNGIEVLLAQKYLELFSINIGTVESIDGVCFYNQQNPDKSLVHLALEKFPDWSIGHIDHALMTMERSFEITRQDVYSFLTQDVANAFGCIFLFNTSNYTIDIYLEENVGENTDIFISYNNLLKNCSISSSTDEIKTCLTVIGADDLSLREVNMGYDKIYMLDYFITEEYMSKELVQAYNLWRKKWEDNVTPYNKLLMEYQNYYKEINRLTNTMMPDDPKSENWDEYGLIPLQEKLDGYNQRLSLMMKVGQGDEKHEDYETLYVPVYNLAKSVEQEIEERKNEINSVKEEQNLIGEQMNEIIKNVDMTNTDNFTSEQLKELSKFIREEELSTDNYIVTDIMTDSERMDMLNDMLDFSQKELAKVSQPQFQFSADIVNLFEIPEFDSNSFQFIPGNYVNIMLRDDYIIKARLLSISEFDFFNPQNFSVTFGNMSRTKGKNIYTDITQAISLAKSASTTVSFSSSNWNRSSKDTSDIGKMIADGLLAAGESLKTSQSDVQIDDRGIFIKNIQESKYPFDGIFIGNSQILFSDDDFKTVRTGLGRLTYTKRGQEYNDFGLIADFVIAGYVGGSTIEGGVIVSTNYVEKQHGTLIDLVGGTFEFNANGEQKLILEITKDDDGNETDALLTVKGKIKADSGYIGGANGDGFTIEDGKMYSSNKSTFESDKSGVYIGTNGISLGEKKVNSKYTSPFMVTSDGTLTATKGIIGGWTITEDNIYNNITFNNTKTGNSTGIGKTSKVTTSAFWAGDGKFLVKQDGSIYAEYGTIAGWTLSKNDLKAETANNVITISSSGGLSSKVKNGDGTPGESIWEITSGGYAYFKNIRMEDTVVIGGNTGLGGINISGNNMWGGFNGNFSAGGGFSADTSFGLSGGALADFDNLVVDRIDAKLVVAETGIFNKIEAKYGFLGKLEILESGDVYCHAGFGCNGNLSATNFVDARDFRFIVQDGRTESLSSRLVNIEDRIRALGG